MNKMLVALVGITMVAVMLTIPIEIKSESASRDTNLETILNINMAEISGPVTNGESLFYVVYIDGKMISRNPPMFYPGGTLKDSVNEFYNVTIDETIVTIEIGLWKTFSGYANGYYFGINQLDLSSQPGEWESGISYVFGTTTDLLKYSYSTMTFDNLPTYRANTYRGYFNTTSKTLTGDATNPIGNLYSINGSSDGSGTLSGGALFSLETFTRSIPTPNVNVNFNATIPTNLTVNQTAPVVNVSVSPPSIDINVSAPNVSVTVPTTLEGANVSLGNLTTPTPIVNITNNPPPISVNVSPPNVSVEYKANGTSQGGITKVYTTAEVQVNVAIYAVISFMAIGIIVVGGIAVKGISMMNRLLTTSEASFQKELEALKDKNPK
jgi:hypothetical protein